MSNSAALTFPPLMSGEVATDTALSHAARRAALGCEAGLVTYTLGTSEIEAALVFAPELPLSRAVAMMPLCGVAFQNALGALAPPEVAVHLDWGGALRVNGAICGQLKAQAASGDPDVIPDWLVVGWTLRLIPTHDETGINPEETALFAEGCADVSPPSLIEAWARHTLNWITRWEGDGHRALHTEWRGLAHGIGDPVAWDDVTGTFLGVDEDFGMLVRDDTATHLIPLTRLLEGPS